MTSVKFFVAGIARPGGSKKAFVNPKTGRAIITDDCSRNKDWRASVVMAAAEKFMGGPLDGPVVVTVTFYMLRPRAHFRANGSLKPTSPRYPTTRPDATKLWRSTEDALLSIAWRDDSQVVSQRVRKRFAKAQPGALIVIRPLTTTRKEMFDGTTKKTEDAPRHA